ncbi:sulfatase-like hydrolase/transferase [Gayadomonas joobiniege]|uniref:sulfatase-like hydrolase/transferase n=1 Tax=Gayadomonas joobiniege TaxID=1234606 RepID=UPI00036478EB|nr:sulfatase-like hydrolase/transferase [Gayadomonas joobiniege]
MKTLIVFCIAVFSLAQTQAKVSDLHKPNIIVIMADDLGYGDLGIYKGVQSTPNLDKMAREGMRFFDFHSSGTVCSPTRAGLLTGRYQQKAGVDGVINANASHPAHSLGVDPQTQITFPKLVKTQGYATALFGKWHLGYRQRFHPMHFGFDRFVGFLSGNIDYISHYDRMEKFDWWHNTEKVVEEGYTTQLITKHAVEFIEKNKNKPFVLYVSHAAVHSPMQGPNSQILRGPNKKKIKKVDEQKVYSEVIAELDKSVGQIITAVEQAGLSESTLILFTSDNGPMKYSSAGPLRGQKGSLYEGGHRVPMIAWWPGVVASNSVTEQLASTLDIMPTIVSLTGAKLPDNHRLDGVDLMPTLLGLAPVDRVLFWRKGGLHFHSKKLIAQDSEKAMRKGKWKLVISPYYEQISLYDLSADISEQDDVAQKHPQIVAQLTARMKAWEEKILPYLPYKIQPQNTNMEQ